jgi:hypothetical protein
MPMPSAMASFGERKCVRLPLTLIGALVGLVGAVEGLHQGGLAGAVLADDRVDRAGSDGEVDPVVGDHAGEPLDDVAQLDGERRGGGRRRASLGCSSRSREGTDATTAHANDARPDVPGASPFTVRP